MTHPHVSAQVPAVVDGAWLEARLADPSIRIIDATTHLRLPAGDGNYTLESGRAAFDREHIPGAVFADVLNEFADAGAPYAMTVPPSAQFEKALGALGVSNDVHIVVYDQLDVDRGPEYYQFWASRFWWHLRLEGHVRVSVLEGGLGRWKREGRPVTSEKTIVEPAQFVARRRPELLARIDDVAAAINADDTVLINVLDDDTFSGKKQTYARPGHIPSSQHVFFGNFIDPATGGYKAPDDVRALFAEAGALDAGVRTIVYCGGGIAATVAALQLSRLGRDDVAIYDGSMTEWASDESRPLVTSF